jgi:protein-disulfide isomerase
MQNRNRSIILGVSALAVIVVIALIVVNRPTTDVTVFGFDDLGKSVSASGHPVLGNPDAPVTMRVYEDLGCPNCKTFWADTEPDIIESYVKAGTVKIEIFTLAFVNASSLPGAEGVLCAADQGYFWEYREVLFQNQGVRAFDRSNLLDWAEDIGMDRSTFGNCFDLGKYQADVVEQSQQAFEFGITGTPTSEINGVRHVGVFPFISTDVVEGMDSILTGALDSLAE